MSTDKWDAGSDGSEEDFDEDIFGSDFDEDEEDFDEDEDNLDSEEGEEEEGEEGGKASKAGKPAGKPKSNAPPLTSLDDIGSDDSDAEVYERFVNTVGDVPMEWYKEYDHLGYDRRGDKVMKPEGWDTKDALDKLIERTEDPAHKYTIRDEVNGQELTLTREELDVIRRIKKGKFPEKAVDPYPDYIPYFTSIKEIHPLSSAPEPKRRFVPSRHEAKRIVKLVNAMRKGWVQEKEAAIDEAEARNYMLWEDDAPLPEMSGRRRRIPVMLAPKQQLPGHDESYNPPEEYLPSEAELAAIDAIEDEEDKPGFVPTKHTALRRVPLYANGVKERFERCVDLYLCPRAANNKPEIDPQTLLPQLPSKDELRPFPTQKSLTFEGHAGKVTSISIHPAGEWMASGSEDGTVRVWEVSTGRCMQRWKVPVDGQLSPQIDSDDEAEQFEEEEDAGEYNAAHRVHCVQWNPNKGITVLAIAAGSRCYFWCPSKVGTEAEAAVAYATLLSGPNRDAVHEDQKLALWEWHADTPDAKPVAVDYSSSKKAPVKKAEAAAKRKQAEQAAADGVFEGSSGCHPSAGKGGYLSLQPLHGFPVRNISWHRKGDYISLVSPRANTSAVFIAHLSRRMVQKPFSKAKDQITGAQFHPAKPFFFVSSKRHIRVYNLAKQTLARKLQPGVQWISSFDCHPGGDNLLLGSFDRRVCWFDLDLSNRPYKTLKLGQQAVRSVAYSPKYPMFAAGNDHGQVQIFHGRVYSDLMQNALIVPLKKLKGHKVVDGVGVMDVKWHPTQPWVITAGADKVIHLFS